MKGGCWIKPNGLAKLVTGSNKEILPQHIRQSTIRKTANINLRPPCAHTSMCTCICGHACPHTCKHTYTCQDLYLPTLRFCLKACTEPLGTIPQHFKFTSEANTRIYMHTIHVHHMCLSYTCMCASITELRLFVRFRKGPSAQFVFEWLMLCSLLLPSLPLLLVCFCV